MDARELLARRAEAVRTSSAEVVSPCVSVCRMSPATALCEGCLRTITEIADWSRMGDADKRKVWGLIEQRAAAAWA